MKRTAIDNIFIFSIFILICVILGTTKIENLDIGWHLKSGEIIWNEKQIKFKDTFSYTAEGRILPPTHWLFQVLIYSIYKQFGLNGVILTKSIVIVFIFSILYRLLIKEAVPHIISFFLCCLGLIFSQGRLLIRPHIFSLLFFIIYYYILLDFRKKPNNKIFVLPVIMLLWTNMHSENIFGLLLIALFLTAELIKTIHLRIVKNEEISLISQPFRKLIAVFTITLIASVGPLGFIHYTNLLYHWSIYGKLSAIDTRPFIYNVDTSFGYFLIIVVFICAINWRKIDITYLFCTLPFLFLSLKAIRFVPLFMLSSAILLGKCLMQELKRIDSSLKKIKIDFSRFKHYYSLEALMAVFLIIQPHLSNFGLGINKMVLPVDGINFINKQKITGRLYNSNAFGGYIIWQCYPRLKVYSDGRLKIYKDILNVPFEEALQRYNFDMIITDYPCHFLQIGRRRPEESIIKKGDWSLVYFDAVCKIFLKKEKKYKQIIKKYGYKYLWIEGHKLFYENRFLNLAISELIRNYKSHPDSSFAQFNLGRLYLKAGQDKKAEQAFLKTLRLRPEAIGARINLGALYLKCGDLEKAEGNLLLASKSKNIKFYPALKKAVHLNLSSLYSKMKKDKKSLKHLEIANKIKLK